MCILHPKNQHYIDIKVYIHKVD